MNTNDIHVQFSTVLMFRKVKLKNEYALKFNIFFSKLKKVNEFNTFETLSKGVSKYTLVGTDVYKLQEQALEIFKNFVSEHELTKGVQMSEAKTTRMKYRDFYVYNSFTAMNLIITKKA